ncbi:MAG TPA: primosomal protein N', partial [Polyangiales bacterium]|nr:primosomal protein N' [Polyangiales bacterium]
MTELFEAIEKSARFVQVAVPVPLRRLFTYRVPNAMSAQIEPGARVAVPFGPRKLAGFVVSDAAAPEELGRIKSLAGVLDSQPLFGTELLAFLVSAADYYLHPLGEVLRSAAPALHAQRISALRDEGFLDPNETLPGRRVAMRKASFVRALAETLPAKLGASQARVLARVIERGELELSELRVDTKNPRAIVRALADKQLVVLEEREVP